MLKTSDGSVLMEQYEPFVEPTGALMTNYGNYAKFKEVMDAAKEEENIKEDDTGLNGTSPQRFELLWKFGILIAFYTIMFN